MTNKIVSAHGGRWSNQQQNLTVPQNSQVVYYVSDGGILDNSTAYKILAQLQAGHEPGGTVVETVNAGSPTYDYSCWNAPEFQNYCGIFAVGQKNPVASLKQYTEDKPLLLSQIFQQYPNCTIYWLCCREISYRPNNLIASPGVWPQMKESEKIQVTSL